MEKRQVENDNGNRLLYYEFEATEVGADDETDANAESGVER